MACENDKCEKYGMHHEYKDGVEIRKCQFCELEDQLKLPEGLKDDRDLGFCYEKKVILSDLVFFEEDRTIYTQLMIINSLLMCMKESNEKNNVIFPYYQLRVRPTRAGELPEGICFELRWGNRDNLKK
jgi:hypothetical protein